MTKAKLLLIAIIAVLIGAFFVFDLAQYLSLEFFQSQKDTFIEFHASQPLLTAAIYFLIYVTVTALSLPAAAVITLAGGAIFGLVWGTVLVSFASTIGATLAFLLARTVLRESVEKKFSNMLGSINAGIEKEGAFYLFGLRLVPIFPFFAVNLLMGLTQMKVRQYFVASQLGMLPGTIVYVNAGTQIAQIESLGDIVSPAVLLSFVLLGVFPIIAKKLLGAVQAKKVYQGIERPKQFDTNMVVIGAGSAGLVSAYIAAATKAKVTLVEKHKMGGDCLNTGCVPSKAIIRSASVSDVIKRAESFGINAKHEGVNFPKVMERVQEVIGKIEPHDSVERYTGLGVDCLTGTAKIIDPFHVEVEGKVLSTRNIVIATGARPFVPDIPGLAEVPHYNSDTVWSLREQPSRMLVLGGGPIGCELAQSFARLGTEVTLISRDTFLLPKEDRDAGDLVEASLKSDGISLALGAEIVAVRAIGARSDEASGEGENTNGKNSNGALRYEADVKTGDELRTLNFDALLLAVGRQANTSGFGLESLDIELNKNGTVKVNEYLQTKYPNIYACGDVAGPFQLTHAASHQAWYVAVNALFGSLKKFKADYRVIPWATFTDPEVARVGLSETEAKEQGIAYEVTRYGIDDLDRAIADSEDHGFVKVLTVPGKDKILGATIVGSHAGDLLTEFVLAMKHGLGLNKILGTIHTYPTMSEANKYLAGEWKRNHAPEAVLRWVEKFHTWKRG